MVHSLIRSKDDGLAAKPKNPRLAAICGQGLLQAPEAVQQYEVSMAFPAIAITCCPSATAALSFGVRMIRHLSMSVSYRQVKAQTLIADIAHRWLAIGDQGRNEAGMGQSVMYKNCAACSSVARDIVVGHMGGCKLHWAGAI